MLRYRWYLIVEKYELKENLINELRKALEIGAQCDYCKAEFRWDPIFQYILEVEVECPSWEAARLCESRITYTLIHECEKRDIAHTIGAPVEFT